MQYGKVQIGETYFWEEGDYDHTGVTNIIGTILAGVGVVAAGFFTGGTAWIIAGAGLAAGGLTIARWLWS